MISRDVQGTYMEYEQSKNEKEEWTLPQQQYSSSPTHFEDLPAREAGNISPYHFEFMAIYATIRQEEIWPFNKVALYLWNMKTRAMSHCYNDHKIGFPVSQIRILNSQN